jgi:hypothetical protein
MLLGPYGELYAAKIEKEMSSSPSCGFSYALAKDYLNKNLSEKWSATLSAAASKDRQDGEGYSGPNFTEVAEEFFGFDTTLEFTTDYLYMLWMYEAAAKDYLKLSL